MDTEYAKRQFEQMTKEELLAVVGKESKNYSSGAIEIAKEILKQQNIDTSFEDESENESEYIPNKKGIQAIWNIFAFIMFCISGTMIYKGYDKISNYYNGGSVSSLNDNAYVGGDAYNYIINSNYATGSYVLALLFAMIGVGFIIIGYLDKIKTIKENEQR